jgi:hypothetical protein
VSYVRHLGPLCTPSDGDGRNLVAELIRALPIRRAEFAAWLPPMERLLRASVALAFAPYLPLARQQAACLLRVSGKRRAPITDGALRRGLLALALGTLDDGISHPFLSFRACGALAQRR